MQSHRLCRNPVSPLLLLAVLVCCTTGGDDDDDDAGGDDSSVWQPAPKTIWQWQLSGALDASFDVAMYDIDLFNTTAEQIADLHSAGRIVVCYFSAGSFEDWRPDASDFPENTIGNPLDDWEGEWWLDIRSEAVRDIMRSRLDLASDKGCDGVEPDNVDAYANDNGFDLNAEDQISFNKLLSEEAHARGLSVGLKNDLGQIDDLLDDFDWALNEECLAYDECDLLDPFIDAGKAVFHVEYVDDWSEAVEKSDEVCGEKPEFSTLIKTWDLSADRLTCQ